MTLKIFCDITSIRSKSEGEGEGEDRHNQSYQQLWPNPEEEIASKQQK